MTQLGSQTRGLSNQSEIYGDVQRSRQMETQTTLLAPVWLSPRSPYMNERLYSAAQRLQAAANRGGPEEVTVVACVSA